MIQQFYEEQPPDGAMLVIKITHYQDGHIEMKIIKAGDYSAPAAPEPHQNTPGTNDATQPAPFMNLQGIRGPGIIDDLYDYEEQPEPEPPKRRVVGSSINVPPFNERPDLVYYTDELFDVIRSPEFKHWVRNIFIPDVRRERAFDEAML